MHFRTVLQARVTSSDGWAQVLLVQVLPPWTVNHGRISNESSAICPAPLAPNIPVIGSGPSVYPCSSLHPPKSSQGTVSNSIPGQFSHCSMHQCSQGLPWEHCGSVVWAWAFAYDQRSTGPTVWRLLFSSMSLFWSCLLCLVYLLNQVLKTESPTRQSCSSTEVAIVWDEHLSK